MPVQGHFVPILLNGLFFDDMMQKRQSCLLHPIIFFIGKKGLERNEKDTFIVLLAVGRSGFAVGLPKE